MVKRGKRRPSREKKRKKLVTAPREKKRKEKNKREKKMAKWSNYKTVELGKGEGGRCKSLEK